MNTAIYITGSLLPIIVRIVRKGDRYGLNDCLTHGETRPLVEFYDGRFTDKFGERGQFISRYYASTLLDDCVRLGQRGLILDGGVAEWKIDGPTMAGILRWIDRNKSGLLRIGDTVRWRGCFGMDGALPATVTEIEVTDYPRSKYGKAVREVEWATVRDNLAVVTLSNGHWAYGEQIEEAQL